MGGKKKTKWRKLPLEEFTKEIPPKQEEQSPTDTCHTDVTREENDFIPSYNGPPEIIQNYAEPYEYVDGIWYPTSCVVYNPGIYTNYMMPADNCYYYCTMPEAGQMQEYMPVPYQEYTPALPKDTVYLLLPTQTFRPTQPVQNVAPDWQNRRRRRRYEGYAEYAVIPEKTSSSKTEERDSSRVLGTQINSRRKSAQFNNFRRMSSFSEASFSDEPTLEQSQTSKKSNEMKKNSSNIDNEKGSNYANKEMGLSNSENMPKKNPEMCGVHSRRKATTNEGHSGNENTNNIAIHDAVADITNVNMKKSNKSDDPLASRIAKENMKNKEKQKEHSSILNNNGSVTGEDSGHDKNVRNFNFEMQISENTLKQKEDCEQEITTQNETRVKNIFKEESQTSLPDIVSSSNKPANEKLQDRYNYSGIHLRDNVDLDKEKNFQQKSSTPHVSHIQNLTCSEALHNELEMELKELQSLKAGQVNQSIYKLAYDENITDQSSNSRSPSPLLSPENNIPSSFIRHDEIIVHEADSDDDAGSEDVEMIPHRYESESYLNQLQNKNLYVNKLSLAVELLRTQESLPYDDDFKRIVGENNVEPSVHSSGNVNLGFRKNSCSPEKDIITGNIKSKSDYDTKKRSDITSQHQINPSPDRSSDSAIFSDTDINNLDNESSESLAVDNEDNTEAIRAGHRRFGAAQRQFTLLPFNPCFCCIIM